MAKPFKWAFKGRPEYEALGRPKSNRYSHAFAYRLPTQQKNICFDYAALCRVFSDYFSLSQFVNFAKLKLTNLSHERPTMKKIVIAALLSAVSGAALATEVPGSASMVFEGASATVTPGASVAITGEGGAPLAAGTLTVNTNGSFTTNAPVKFEIRDASAEGVGDVSTSTNLQMKYSTIELVAGPTLGVVPSTDVKVALTSGVAITTADAAVTARNGLSVSKTTATAGYIPGEVVKTTVAVLVTNPAA